MIASEILKSTNPVRIDLAFSRRSAVNTRLSVGFRPEADIRGVDFRIGSLRGAKLESNPPKTVSDRFGRVARRAARAGAAGAQAVPDRAASPGATVARTYGRV